MANSATSKVIGEGIIQFCSHGGCITTIQGIRLVLNSKHNPISLGVLQGEGFGFSFSYESDFMKISKEARVKFQAERVGNVYMLRNSKVTVSRLLLSSASKANDYGTIEGYDGFEFGCSVEFRRETGTRRAIKKFRLLLLWWSKFS